MTLQTVLLSVQACYYSLSSFMHYQYCERLSPQSLYDLRLWLYNIFVTLFLNVSAMHANPSSQIHSSSGDIISVGDTDAGVALLAGTKLP